MHISQTIFWSVFSAIAMIAVTPAFAEDNQTPKVYVHRTYEHQEDNRLSHHYKPNLGRAGEMAISDHDRALLNRYVNHYYKNTCAWEHDYRFKKCVAPQAPQKKNYIIGYALPSHVTYADLPSQVTARLRTPPYGYKYVRVENDVLLINASSTEVIDAVTLLSAYGQ